MFEQVISGLGVLCFKDQQEGLQEWRNQEQKSFKDQAKYWRSSTRMENQELKMKNEDSKPREEWRSSKLRNLM